MSNSRYAVLLAAIVAVTEHTASIDPQGGRGDRSAASVARTVTLPFQGRMRQYVLYVPAASNGSLVLAFHGGGQVAAQMQQTTGLDALADREHFVVAYPEAVQRSWNDGGNFSAAERQAVDDVDFAKAVVADIAGTHAIDRTRVFATGLSNGGVFTHRL